MSEVKVNKISPRTNCGTVQLGDSGDSITIPSGVTITNSGTAAGFGSTGEVSWNTTKITADPGPAVSGVGYFTDTSSSAFDITLPSSPSAGAVVAVADYANNWNTNAVTLLRNGSNIEGEAKNFKCNKQGSAITFVYVDATKGWIAVNAGNSSQAFTNPFTEATGGNAIVEDGDYKIHIFTGPGTFCVSNVGSGSGPGNVDYLVVAGGGGATYGGGGAGGFRNCVSTCGTIPIEVTGYPITVGSGGSGGPANSSRGGNSIFSSITSTGGGGSSNSSQPPSVAGPNAPGGSGAGGPGFDFPAPSPGSPVATDPQAAGVGNTPPVSPPQGNPGGTGHGTFTTTDNGSGGGGGAGSAASNTSIGTPGGTAGGAGAPTSIFGSTPTAPSYGESGPSPGRYFAGGGGGSQQNPGTNAGGVGGGGDGKPGGAGCSGVANTGGGAGGQNSTGGSGIVVIRYKFQ